MANQLINPLPSLFRGENSDYIYVQELGSGAQALVYEAVHRPTGRPVAVKRLMKKTRKAMMAAQLEYNTTKGLQHPNVVAAIDCIETREDNSWYMVFELADGGDLFDQFNTEELNTIALRPDDATTWVSDLAEALAYVHSQGLVHRDIKPENVLIAKGRAQLCDFGMAIDNHTCVRGRMPGTGSYMAPEVIQADFTGSSLVVDTAIDVWAFGILFYAIVFADLPWEEAEPNDPDYKQFLADGGVQPHLYPYSLLEVDVCRMLGKMLAPNPKDRCTMAEVSKFFEEPREWRVSSRNILSSQRLQEHTEELAEKDSLELLEDTMCELDLKVQEEDMRTSFSSLYSASTASLLSLNDEELQRSPRITAL